MIKKGLVLLFFLASNVIFAQQEQKTEVLDSAHINLDYEIDAVGVVKSGDYVPMYMVNNNHGKLSPNVNNGYLEGKIIFNSATQSGIKFGAGVDLIGSVAKYSNNYGRNFHVQQMYVDFGYKRIGLSVGEKEELPFLVDYDLSSGNLVWSENTSPVGRVKIGTTEFVPVPWTNQWLNFYVDMSYGRQFDGGYTQSLYDNYEKPNIDYHYTLFVKSPYLHRKNFFIQTKKDAAVVGLIGVEHAAQYGGTSIQYGNYSSGMKDMINVFAGKQAGATNYNHIASVDAKLTFNLKDASVGLYGQRYVDNLPVSTPLFGNGLDGLWGLDIKLKKFKCVNHIVMEYLQTTIQENSVSDDANAEHYVISSYYNDDTYGAWASYGLANGNPLLRSPIYNNNTDKNSYYYNSNYPMFTSTLVRAWHLGFRGNITDALDYKILMSHMTSWGEPLALFNEKQSDFSMLLQAAYRWKTWKFASLLSVDNGDYFRNGTKGTNFAFALKVSKFGVLLKK